MANETMNKNNENNSNRNEERSQNEQGRQNEQGQNQNRDEKSAIGGGQTSETGEPGRARSELDQNKDQGKQSPTGEFKSGEFDKNRSETTSR